MKLSYILSKCDHTLLAQNATWDEIKATIDDGINFKTASVCIPASSVKMAKQYAADKIKICTVIGFPNGYSTTAVKVFECKDALENGADEIYIIGGLSGRLDHTLSNLYLIEALTNCGIYACICDGKNRVRYIKERSSLLIPKDEYKYFGLLPSEKEAKGVTIKGAKYPLENAKLEKNMPSFAISNEVAENFAMVSCKKGGLFVIESKELSK